MEKKQKKTDSEKEEREYIIPLRRKLRNTPRYKKTSKAIRSIKEFLARHMKVRDRDLKKIKLDIYLNEFVWARGIKKPPAKIKVKAVKEGENVRVELAELPEKIKFKKLRIEKQDKKATEEKKKEETRPSVAELKKTKNKRKILDEILLAKAFCYANKYYGAESHIKGFSGYSLELLVYHYKSFLGFIRAVSKIKKTEIIDIEKYYKNKNSVLMDLNSAKLQSPMILVDPTYKQRNVLAVLSHETFKKFQDDCRVFLKNPKKEIFVRRKTDFNLLIKNSKTKKHEFILIEIKTDKKEESIAGSKLLKFFNYLNNEIGKKFEIRNKKFEYENGQTAKCFFSAVKIEKITITGPKFDDAENVKRFRKKHKKTFIKNKRIYSEEKPNLRLSKFIENWNQKNKKQMKDMHITNIRILL